MAREPTVRGWHSGGVHASPSGRLEPRITGNDLLEHDVPVEPREPDVLEPDVLEPDVLGHGVPQEVCA
jgi:hypothetical protein